jgi:CheY-like chemotaxis protein
MLVLFIDDDPDDYDLFCHGLKIVNDKAECLYVQDGLEALNLLNNELTILPDYIFLDVNMPLMGGEECLQEIKKNPDLQDIPIIVYSTTSDLVERGNLRRLGAAAFVVKPAKFNDLVDVLRKVLI